MNALETVTTRESVARSLFCAARPGHHWDHQPPEVTAYWGTLADAATAQVAVVLGAEETRAAFLVAADSVRGGLDNRIGSGLDAVARILTGRRS